MFSTPASFNDKIKAKFMDLFINHFKVMAVSMACQAILSLYSYNTTSGVVVDIGDRIEILPVADGKCTKQIILINSEWFLQFTSQPTHHSKLLTLLYVLV